MEEVEIPINENPVLVGNIFLASRDGKLKKPAALLIHGWQSGQDRMFDTAQMFSTKLGVTCLTFDLRGHGKSVGNLQQLSRKVFLDDVIAVYDLLAKRDDVDTKQIGVLGSSFGSYLAALLSSKRKIDWMVLRAPADYPDKGFELPKLQTHEQLGVKEWRSQPRNWESSNALKSLHSFNGKVLIVESGKDETLPRQTLLNYKNAASDKRNLKYVIMENAPHSLTGHSEFKEKFNNIVYEWYRDK